MCHFELGWLSSVTAPPGRSSRFDAARARRLRLPPRAETCAPSALLMPAAAVLVLVVSSLRAAATATAVAVSAAPAAAASGPAATGRIDKSRDAGRRCAAWRRREV